MTQSEAAEFVSRIRRTFTELQVRRGLRGIWR